MKTITAYKLAKLTNEDLKKEGLPEIKPQMIYNYVKNNLIKTNEKGEILEEVGLAWKTKYITNKKARFSSN